MRQVGVAIIAEALTDNRNRTGGAVRSVFTKYDGNLGSTGSVSHMFTHVGEITYKADKGTADSSVLEAAIEAARRRCRLGRSRPCHHLCIR